MALVNRNPTVSEVRSFGWVILGGFAVIAGLLWYLGRSAEAGWGYSGGVRHTLALCLVGFGLLVALICQFSYAAGKPIYVVWMTAATYLGVVMTCILLSVLFFVMLPIFSLIRLKDPLRFKLAPAGESYWEDHTPHEATLERTARQF